MPDVRPDRSIPGFEGRSAIEANERGAILNLIGPQFKVLEIGTLDGVTVAWWAGQRPEAQFISVDPFRGGHGTGPGFEKCWRANAKGNQRLIIGTASHALKDSGLCVFDLVIVDGDHSYAWTLADLCIAQVALKAGGILLLHDYGRDKDKYLADVTKAAHRFAEMFNYKVERISGTVARLWAL